MNLIVTVVNAAAGQHARKIDRELPAGLRETVGIITASALSMIAPPQTQKGETK